MAYARKDYLGTRADTTLNGGINASTTSITITSATGWPSVTNTGFYAVIDPDVAGSEEKVFVTARSGTGLTVTRGVDGTTGVTHASGAVIRPTFSGVDADEANYMVTQTVGTVTTAGDMLKASAANTFTRMAKGSNSTVLAVDSGGTLGYTTAATAMFADSAVSNAKLAGMTRGTVKVGNSSGAASDLALGASGKFLSSDGTDVVWGDPEWTTCRKTADETSSGSSVYDAELTFTTSAGVYYLVEYVLAYSGTGTSPDLFVTWEEGGQTQGRAPAMYYDDSVVVMPDAALGQAASSLNLGVKNGTRIVSGQLVLIAAGGTFQLRFVSTLAGNTTLKAGSYIRYKTLT